MENKDLIMKNMNSILDKHKGELGISDIRKLIFENGVNGKLENGKWINGEIYAPKGVTPIVLASRLGYTYLVRIMVYSGADVNSYCHKNKSALAWAVFNEHTEIVKILIDAGANVDMSDENGYTILMLSFLTKRSRKSLNICKMLIDAGANVNAQTKLKETSLMFASAGGYTEVVRILLAADVIVNLKNKFGETALDMALTRNNKEIADLLRLAGAIEFANTQSMTEKNVGQTARL